MCHEYLPFHFLALDQIKQLPELFRSEIHQPSISIHPSIQHIGNRVPEMDFEDTIENSPTTDNSIFAEDFKDSEDNSFDIENCTNQDSTTKMH